MNPVYVTVSITMDDLLLDDPAVFQAAVAHARGGPLDPAAIPTLEDLALVQDGIMHDLTAEAIRFLYPAS